MQDGLHQSDQPESTTAKAMVEAVFRHRNAFLVSAGLILLGTILLTVLMPRVYSSEMDVLVRNARPDYLLSPLANTGQLLQHDVTEERINSEIEVLRSKDVADEVVDPGWTLQPLSQRTPERIHQHDKAVVDYLKHLNVQLLRKSNVIQATYEAGTPQAATATLTRLLAAFLVKQREIERSTGASSFFGNEAARYKAELDQAQAQLAGYQQANRLVSLPSRETTLDNQVNALEDAIRQTQVQVSEAENRVASDRHQLSTLPERVPTQQRSIPNTQAVEQLVAALTAFQNKRTEYLTRYQPTDRLIAEVDQQIATTSRALAEARATNGQESTTDVNPVYQQVKSTLASSETDLAAYRARLAGQVGQREALRQQLGQVEGSTVDYNTLQTRVAELTSNYQLYTQKKTEAEVADSMDQHQLINVAVAENPTFSAKPVRPRVLLYLLLGLFTALFTGACVVFFAELGRDTIGNASELEALSGTPVLATIPYESSSWLALDEPRRPVRPVSPRAPEPRPAPDQDPGGLPAYAAQSGLASFVPVAAPAYASAATAATATQATPAEPLVAPQPSPAAVPVQPVPAIAEAPVPVPVPAAVPAAVSREAQGEPATASVPARLREGATHARSRPRADRAARTSSFVRLFAPEPMALNVSDRAPASPDNLLQKAPPVSAAEAPTAPQVAPQVAPLVASRVLEPSPIPVPPTTPQAVPEPASVPLEPREPESHPQLPAHLAFAEANVPADAAPAPTGPAPDPRTLSPSQRARLRRPAVTRDRDGRVTRVTYS